MPLEEKQRRGTSAASGATPRNAPEGSELPMIPADPERLKQVFLNILDNAMTHGGDGKMIDVTLGRDNGYILDFDGFRVYVSGDTEDIDEMAGFGPLDVAFLSANQPYTMTTTQCVDAAMTLDPKVLVPYHLSNTDMQEIKNVLDSNDSGIEVLLFEELR